MMLKAILPKNHRTTHTYMIGQPGVGKSRALESWIMQDIAAGNGVGVIDPHGDLYQNLVSRLALKPQLWERVILIDPTDPNWVVSFNPLSAMQGQSQERVALFMTDIVIKLWSINPASAPRMVWLMTNTFLALAASGLSLVDLPLFLLDKSFRDSQLPKVHNQMVRNYFELEYPSTPKGAHQWATPVLNKMGSLLFDPGIRQMLSGNPSLNFRKVMDSKQVLLVNLAKGILGENASSLLGAFIVARLQKAALSRADSSNRTPFYLYLDEFQHYTTGHIKDVLAESRKYALSLVLAHQYLDQLPTDIRSAVLNTAGTIACFRVGFDDANRMAKEIFPSPNFFQRNRSKMVVRHKDFWPQLALEHTIGHSTWGEAALKLTQLKHREFWVRQRRSNTPNKIRTYDMPGPKETNKLRARCNQLKETSGKRYGRRKVFQSANSPYPPPPSTSDVPLWEA